MSGEEVIWGCWLMQGLFCGVGALIAVLSLPMYFEKIPPNRWYGIRTKKTLANETLWYHVNKTAGKYLLYACLFIFILNLLFLGRFLCHPEHAIWVFIMLGGQLVLGDGALLVAVGIAMIQIDE